MQMVEVRITDYSLIKRFGGCRVNLPLNKAKKIIDSGRGSCVDGVFISDEKKQKREIPKKTKIVWIPPEDKMFEVPKVIKTKEPESIVEVFRYPDVNDFLFPQINGV